MCGKRVMAPHLDCVLCLMRVMTVQVYTVLAIFSKTNHHLFSLQKCRLILIRVMGDHLVKVLILIRVMCGTRVTLLSFGTREYYMKLIF